MAQGFSLKDQLFNPVTIGLLAGQFEKAGVFVAAPFIDDVLRQIGPLELKARISLIADVLARYLPADFAAACDAILAALPPPLDPALSDDDFGHFIYAPLGVVVENHGLDGQLPRSLDLLEAITQRFSMEFSIRAFLKRWPAETLYRMQDWVHHDSYHVRRLVSEGTRPRLPWGQGIGLTSAQTLPLLDQLHGDRTRFVTRSVANHLNDISKQTPGDVLARLDIWTAQGAQAEKELLWMRKHALRGLIKAGHAGAMAHLGYGPDVDVTLTDFAITPASLPRGDTATIALTLTCSTDAALVVDYVIDFIKANGTTAPKVFKLRICDAKAGEPINLSKRHTFKGDATTFRLNPGAHQVHVQVNGRIIASVPFALT